MRKVVLSYFYLSTDLSPTISNSLPKTTKQTQHSTRPIGAGHYGGDHRAVFLGKASASAHTIS